MIKLILKILKYGIMLWLSVAIVMTIIVGLLFFLSFLLSFLLK